MSKMKNDSISTGGMFNVYDKDYLIHNQESLEKFEKNINIELEK